MSNTRTQEIVEEHARRGIRADMQFAPSWALFLRVLVEFEREPYEPWRLAGRAIAFHYLKRDRDAHAPLDQLQSRSAAPAYFALALAHTTLGEVDLAFETLARGMGQNDVNCIFLGVDPLLAEMHRDARFAGLPLRDASRTRHTASLLRPTLCLCVGQLSLPGCIRGRA